MNEITQLQIPETIIKQIKSKPKLHKLTFLDKINLLIDWAKDDEEKIKIIGIEKVNNDFSVNIPVLSDVFNIKERSILKNFNLNHYQRSYFQPRKDRILFTKQRDISLIVHAYNKVEEEVGKKEALNWDSEMVNNWISFIEKYPDKKVSDFALQFSTHKSTLTISQLIEYLIQSDEFDASMFQFIYAHFSPLRSIPDKISSLLTSVFSRGWVVGEGPKTIKLLQPYGFLFDDGNQQVILYNNLSCIYPGLWLVNEDESEIYEPECFFEKYFPREIPSNDNFIDIMLNYFPEVLEECDDDDDNDDSDDD